MNDIALPGLAGSNPLGAMAACGLLRILTVEAPESGPALAWRFTDDWTAILRIEGFASADELVEWLVARQANRHQAPFLSWNDDIKVKPELWTAELSAAVAQAEETEEPSSIASRERCDFLAAFASEMVTARSTGDIKPTAFHMTAGQQRFLKSGVELAQSIDIGLRSSKRQTAEQRKDECRGAIAEALVGPWRYQDRLHALGWDPTTEGLHALSDISPSEAKPRSARAAVWLAFESLSLFPCAPAADKLVTTGFDLRDRRFTWPIWEQPLHLETVRSLVAHPMLCKSQFDHGELRALGIGAIFRCQCLRDANGRGTFRNAVLVDA